MIPAPYSVPNTKSPTNLIYSFNLPHQPQIRQYIGNKQNLSVGNYLRQYLHLTQQLLKPDRAHPNALETKQFNLFHLQYLYLPQQQPKPDRAHPNALLLEQFNLFHLQYL